MKDDDTLPTTTTTVNVKKESADSCLFGRGRYKFWAFAAILLLAFWSMFTGTVTLRWSVGNLNRLSDDIGSPIHDDLDVLEMEEREKVVKHVWDVYTNSRRIRLPRFWQEAFEAAYEELTSDVPGVREAAITEIAKMSVRYVDLDPPPIQSTIIECQGAEQGSKPSTDKWIQGNFKRYVKKIAGSDELERIFITSILSFFWRAAQVYERRRSAKPYSSSHL